MPRGDQLTCPGGRDREDRADVGDGALESVRTEPGARVTTGSGERRQRVQILRGISGTGVCFADLGAVVFLVLFVNQTDSLQHSIIGTGANRRAVRDDLDQIGLRQILVLAHLLDDRRHRRRAEEPGIRRRTGRSCVGVESGFQGHEPNIHSRSDKKSQRRSDLGMRIEKGVASTSGRAYVRSYTRKEVV